MATTKLYIVNYSLHGHVETMAREVQRGANAVQGVEATLWQVPETLSNLILQKMKAPAKADDVPEIRPEQLMDADGFLFGFPSRFGVMAAQFKAFFDATNEQWERQALAGKPAGIFWSTGFHGGGQELTAGMFEMNEVKGGSCYGAGTYAADGSREPTDLELQQAFHQGRLHRDLAPPLVHLEARQAVMVQGPGFRHPQLHSTPRGVVSVGDCLTVKGAEDIVNKAFAFELSTRDSTMYFVADTEKEKEDWINSIGRSIVQHSRSVTDSEVIDYDSKRAENSKCSNFEALDNDSGSVPLRILAATTISRKFGKVEPKVTGRLPES
ncbi:hypothetical protein CRYUN_Cryun11dG0121900 [Craigia yunnanensis]